MESHQNMTTTCFYTGATIFLWRRSVFLYLTLMYSLLLITQVEFKHFIKLKCSLCIGKWECSIRWDFRVGGICSHCHIRLTNISLHIGCMVNFSMCATCSASQPFCPKIIFMRCSEAWYETTRESRCVSRFAYIFSKTIQSIIYQYSPYKL